MNDLALFLPCPAGVESLLADELARVADIGAIETRRGGVAVQGTWRSVLQCNLHSRLAQRVLVQLFHAPYRSEQDLYRAASEVAWEAWFTPRQTFKIEVTAQHSPLTSLNFAALKIKDAIADRFRAKAGDQRPSVDTQRPDVRVFAHLTTDTVTLYIDTSGEALFKRGWREDKGDAPLKETLAAAMLAASGWSADPSRPLYDPCCGSGTIAIEAAQIACGIAPGRARRFAFQKMRPFQPHVWDELLQQARGAERLPAAGAKPRIFGSDVAHRMVDFAQRNAARAGVAQALELRGGDALQRMPPTDEPGILMLNPPYGERIAAAGVAGTNAGVRAGVRAAHRRGGEAAVREQVQMEQTEEGSDFFAQLAAHWKRHYAGWSAWVLTPDLQLPRKMRLKESRRVPLWNGPIECRLFRFDMVQGSARSPSAAPAPRAA